MKQAKRFLGLLLLLPGANLSLPAQAPPATALNLQVQWADDHLHWADNNNCVCTLTVVRKGVNGEADTTIYVGTTDSGGNLHANLPLDPFSAYVATLHDSTYYQMDIYATWFLTPVPLKSLQLHLRLTRPQVNGVDQAAPAPVSATPPSLTSGTQAAIQM